MIIYDKDKIIEWLTEISLRPCDFSRPEDYDDNMTEDLADGALEILKGPIAARPVADWVEDSDPGELIGAHWKCSNCEVCYGEPMPWRPLARGWRFCPSCGYEMEQERFV